jgi:hypothetical protein
MTGRQANDTVHEVRYPAQLYSLRRITGLNEVRIISHHLKRRGLLLHAVKYAYWAVKQGGVIHIEDNGPDDQGIQAWRITFPMVRQLALVAIGNGCERPEVSASSRTISLRRKEPVPPPGWSGGVVFSGDDKEIPQLTDCLTGLMNQMEFRSPQGEIFVCGPERNLDFLKPFPEVQYVVYDTPPTKPFPISDKKNTLIARMRGPRLLVLHARIALEDGAISHAPAEFDILSPNVFLRAKSGLVPNTCYSTIDPRSPNLLPRLFSRSTRTTPPASYLGLLRRRRPYVDGGAFMVMKHVYERCPLHDHLGWGDCEDVEWCRRAEALGFLVDLDPEVRAVSSISKVTNAHNLPRPVHSLLQTMGRTIRGAANLLKLR